MSHQTTLTNFFKSRVSPIQKRNSMNSNKNNKRHSLSLKKTSPNMLPAATCKEVIFVEKKPDVITLSSDSDHESTPAEAKKIKLRDIEELFTPEATPKNQNPNTSNSSVTEIVCYLSPGDVYLSPTDTPTKTSGSSGSSKKFYSPTKKRILNKRSPAKRKLANIFDENITPQPTSEDNQKEDKYKDDKTAFLRSIIDKYLRSDNLKHLLEDESQTLLEKFKHLEKPGMRLMCRLYWRQPGWYVIEELGKIASGNKEGLSSPELWVMINCLVEHGFITPADSEGNSKMDFDDYVKLLKRPVLQQICKELKLKMQSKQDAVEALRFFCKSTPISNFFTGNGNNNRTRVLKILKSKTGHCYKMSDLARTTFYNLYVLMYFGIDYSIIRDKKLELMQINDQINLEPYPIDKRMVVDDASVVFQNREEFYRYLQAHVTYEEYLEETDINKKCEIVKQAYNLYKTIEELHMRRYISLPVWLRNFTPANIYVKTMWKGVNELKKLRTEENYLLALNILDTLIGQIAFRQHRKAEWYAEKALILHTHLDSSEEAAKALLQGFKSDLSEEAKDSIRPRAKKIANQQNVDISESIRDELRSYATKEAILESELPGDHIYKQPKENNSQGGKLKFEVFTSDGRMTVSVEDYCIYYYTKTDGSYTHGEHWEGRIVTTIFYLLFWDIIYTKPSGVTGVFMSHYQRRPLDLFSDSFYTNRKALIDDRLMFIQECTLELLVETMKCKWHERPEKELSGINRDIGWDNIRAVTSCLGARETAAVCRRLATNYGYARTGFPDITLWNIHEKKIKFVEAKSDRDKPSMKQLQWLRYLLDNNIDAGLTYVGVNTTSSRARPSPNTSQSSRQ